MLTTIISSMKFSASTRTCKIVAKSLWIIPAMVLAGGGPAFAANETWSSTSSGSWSTTGNWNGNAAPGSTSSTTSTDTATFSSSSGGTVTIDQTTQNIGSLTFSGASTGSFTIGGSGANAGNALLLSSGGAITDSTTDTGTTVETINAPLVLEPATSSTAGTYNFTSSGSTVDTLTVAGGISGGATSSSITLALAGTNTGTNTISGPISNGSNDTGGLALTKSGAGEWVLSGSNTYSGGTTLSAGTLIVSGTGTTTYGALGTGTLTWTGGTLGVIGAGTGATLYNNISTSGSLTISMTGITMASSLVLDGNLSGSGNIYQVGQSSSSSIVVLNGNNSNYTGTYSASSGNNRLDFDSNTAGSASATWLFNPTNAAGDIQIGTGTTSVTGVSFGALGTITGTSSTGNSLRTSSTNTITITEGALNTSTTFAMPMGQVGTGGVMALTKVGTGVFTLSAANTFTGTTTISAGAIDYENATAFGANSPITVSSGATAQVQGGIASVGTTTLTLSGAGATSLTGGANESAATGALENFSGNNSATMPIVLAAASTISSDSGTLTLSGNVTGAYNLTLASQSSGNGVLTFSTGTVNVGGTVTNNGAGSGTVTIGNVGANVTGLTENSAASTLVISGALATNSGGTTLTNSNGSGSALLSVTGSITGANAVALDNNSSVANGITISGAISNTGAITNSGSGNGSTLISGAITGSAASVTQNSASSGLSLTGSNTYTGATLVSAGALTVGGSGSINNSSGISINATNGLGSGASFVQTSSVASTPTITITAGTLYGTGTAGAVIVANSNNAVLSNGTGNGTTGGTLTVGSITFNGVGDITAIAPGATTATSSIVDLGALNLNLSDLVTVNLPTTVNVTGTLDLLNFSSITNGATVSDFTLGTVNYATGFTGTLVLTSNELELVASGDSPKWTGNSSGSWQTGLTGATSATTNWQYIISGNPANYADGQAVLFDDTATGTTAVTINSGTVNPLSVTFNNSALTYSFTGTNGIGSADGAFIVKNGTGTVTMATPNSYTGSTTINAGVYNLQNSSALGSSVLTTVASGAALQLQGGISIGSLPLTLSGSGPSGKGALESVSGNNSYAGLITLTGATTIGSDTAAYTLTLSNTGTMTGSGDNLTLTGAGNGSLAESIGTGAGSLTMNSTGTWTLSGANTYTGGTTINGGTIIAGSSSALGAATNTLTFGSSSNGTFLLNGQSTTVGSFSGDSTATIANSNATTATLTDNTMGTGTFAGTLQNGTTGTLALTMGGSGKLILSGTNNTESGATTVNNGTLQYNGTGAMSSAAGSALTLANGTTLNLYSNAGGTFTPGAVSGQGNTLFTSTSLTPSFTINVGPVTNGGSGQSVTLSGTTEFYINNATAGTSILNVGNGNGSTGDSLTLSAVAIGGGNNIDTFTFDPSSGATLNIGSITGDEYNGTYEVINFSGAGNTNVTGSITQAGATRSLALTFNQTGAVTLSGSNNLRTNSNPSDATNTYLTVDSGTVNFNNTNAIYNNFNTAGNSGNVTNANGVTTTTADLWFYLNGGTIDNTSGGALTLAGLYTLDINGNFSYGGSNNLTLTPTVLTGAGGSSSPSAAVYLTSASSPTITTAGSATLTISGTIAGGGTSGAADGITVAGTGNLTLSGSNTFTGGVTVTGGTLNLNGSNAYTGSTLVQGGTLNIGSTGTLTGSTVVTVSNGATFNVTSGGSILATTNLTDNGNANFNNPTRTLATLNGTNTGALLTLNSTNLTVSGGGSFAGVIQNGGSAGALTVSGSTLTLTNAETYTGSTTISAGTLALGNGGALSSGGSVVANGAFDISQSGNQTIGDLSGSGVVNLGSYQLEINDSNSTTFSGQINYGGLGGGTGGSLLVDGGQVLILSGSNSFTGLTTVAANTESIVEYESSASFAQTSAIVVGNTSAIQLSGGIAGGSKSVSIAGTGYSGSNNAALDSVSGGNSLAGVVNLTGNAAISTDSGTLTLSGGVSEGAHTLTVKGSGDTTIGAITGSTGGLTVNASSGLVDLTGSNTYGGATIITNGTLELGNGGTAGSIATTSPITDNGNFTVDRSNAVAQGTDFTASPISGNGSFTQAGSGTTTLSSANTYLGGTTVSSGGLIVSNGTNGSATGSGTFILTAGASLGGAGQISASLFTLGAASPASAANVVVGNGTDSTSQLTLTGSSSTSNNVTNVQLAFNISATTPGQSNVLNVGNSQITFSATTLELNVQGLAWIGAYTPYLLIQGNGTNQYVGLTTTEETLNGVQYAVITDPSALELAWSQSYAQNAYGANSVLILNTTGGADDIEVLVVPEPSTWAMMLGGLALLILIQRRKSNSKLD